MKPRSLRSKLSWRYGLIISLILVGIGLVRYATIAYLRTLAGRLYGTFRTNLCAWKHITNSF